MLEFARSHLQEGHTYLMWKDTVFNYSYFLWFEDISVSIEYINVRISIKI